MVLVDLKLLRNLGKTDLHSRIASGTESAALGKIQHVDGCAEYGLKLLSHVGKAGDGAEKTLCVFVFGVVEDRIGNSLTFT